MSFQLFLFAIIIAGLVYVAARAWGALVAAISVFIVLIACNLLGIAI